MFTCTVYIAEHEVLTLSLLSVMEDSRLWALVSSILLDGEHGLMMQVCGRQDW